MKNASEHLSFCFESHGVKVRLHSNSKSIFEKAVDTVRTALLEKISEIGCDDCEHTFYLELSEDGMVRTVQNGEELLVDRDMPNYWKYVDSLARLLVADFAENVVFIHAGVVAWKGTAIVMPGNSFYGKTTLVSELVKLGAEYYSDEYAIIDFNGLVHPFSRALWMRDRDGIRSDKIDVESFGGQKGIDPIPVSIVLFTKFDQESNVEYVFLSSGQGVLKALSFTINPRRFPETRIKLLKNAFSDAIIVESPRSDAADFARQFLEFVDNKAI